MHILIYFIGGLVFFLYGQQLLEDGLQKTSRFRGQRLLQLLARHPLAALLLGSLFTIGTQSSTAAVTTLVSVINAGLLRLPQAAAMLLGASIGSTLMVQVIAFRIANFGLLFAAVGFLLCRIDKKRWGGEGELLFGLGLMFYGVSLMGQGMIIFKETVTGASFLQLVCVHPLVTLLISFLITFICQSTLVPLALGITLVQEGGLPLVIVLPVILGSHLGASILPLLAGWKRSGSQAAKQLAWANFGYRLLSSLIFFPLLVPWAGLTEVISGLFVKGTVASGRLLANAHSIFTIISVVLFFPLVKPATRILVRLIPAKEPARKVLRYLTPDLVNTPDRIDAAAREELTYLAGRVQDLFKRTRELWEKDSFRELISIEIESEEIYVSQEAFSKYLTGLSRKQMPAGWVQQEVKLLGLADNLQKIGNALRQGLLRIFKKKISQGVNFSIEGLNELLSIHGQLITECQSLMTLLAGNKREKDILLLKEKIDFLFQTSQLAHIERLHRGVPETRETASLHLEAVTVLEHIHGYLWKIFQENI